MVSTSLQIQTQTIVFLEGKTTKKWGSIGNNIYRTGPLNGRIPETSEIRTGIALFLQNINGSI